MADAWAKFPYPAFAYTPVTLRKAWGELHKGDAEPWPKDEAVVDAWLAFHAGDFPRANELGLNAGGAGITAANKAQAIYANYLEPDERRRLALLEEVAERAAVQQKREPTAANAFYWQAYALGRYGQGISIVRALAQGIGSQVRTALDTTLRLAPTHADAHIASGTYHAEIIDKVGNLLGGLTYGASKDLGLKHFAAALALDPGSAIARIEYASGLMMLEGHRARGRAAALYAEAAACTPHDAMEALDVDLARMRTGGSKGP